MQNIIDNESNYIELIENTGKKYSEISKIKGGKNSSVYFAQETNGELYCFKFYPKPTRRDKRERLMTEKKFLEYLEKCGIENIPRIQDMNNEENWIMTNWIEGKKPRRLAEAEIERTIEFIKNSNKLEMKGAKGKLRMASEALTSNKSLKRSINKRINKFCTPKPSNNTELETKRWIQDIIIPLKYRVEELQNGKDFHIKEEELIASQSDIGIHNMISSKGEIFFIDFEYAGKDNIVKLVADLMYQPEHNMSEDINNYLISRLDKEIGDVIQKEWKEQLELIKPLICIKWSLIILNNSRTEKDLEQKLEKAKKYIGKHEKIFSRGKKL